MRTSSRALVVAGLLVAAGSAPARAQGRGTLVVPVEFADVRFGQRGDLAARLRAWAAEAQAYYHTVLAADQGPAGLSREALAQAFPALAGLEVTAPVRLVADQRRYGRDHLGVERGDQGLRFVFRRDVGVDAEGWAGQRALRRDALRALFQRGEHPERFAALVFVCAGRLRGNLPGSPQLWPTSMGRDPAQLGWRDGELTGYPDQGVVLGEGDSRSTLTHELGHQLGLPDLYLDPSRTGTDAGPITELANGARGDDPPIGLTALERAWLAGQAEGLAPPPLTRLAPHGGGTFTVVARDADAPRDQPRALLIESADGSPGGFLVEVFDRHGVDRAVSAAPRLRDLPGRVDAGVLITRVDAFELDALTRIQPVGPRPLAELLPADAANRLPGLACVFLPGDAHAALDGTTLRVIGLRQGAHGRVEAELQITRGDPPQTRAADRRRRVRELRQRLLDLVERLVGDWS